MINNIIAPLTNFVKQLRLERYLVVFIALGVLLISNPVFAANEKPIGDRVGEQQHETSVKSERPKTTGEFLDEARQDIPLNERLSNITRDSKEAFQQFGEGITTSIKESAKEITGNKQS